MYRRVGHSPTGGKRVLSGLVAIVWGERHSFLDLLLIVGHSFAVLKTKSRKLTKTNCRVKNIVHIAPMMGIEYNTEGN